MLYEEYEVHKNKYYEAQKKYDDILSEKEVLFVKTLTKATTYDKEVVSGGKPSNTFDEYLIAKEKKQIDERLEEARSILEDRTKLLKLKEEELRLSNNPYDKIYIYRFIDRLKVYKISRLVGYGEAQIYRILKIIRKNVKMIENDRKIVIR
jgi:hypothetical protein